MINLPYFTCSFPYNSEDQNNIIEAWNQGIDSRLEGFTRSKNEFDGSGRLFLYIANVNEFQTLVRRLLELESYNAECLADDMIYVQYDYEVI